MADAISEIYITILQGKEITIDLLRSGNGAALNFELTSYIHKIYTSIDDLDPDYDAIFITNPTSCHFPVFFNFNT